jgi:voltage-gated potassium channel
MAVMEQTESSLRHRLHTLIFEADTRAGRWFDIFLLVVIVISVAAVMLDSIESINAEWSGTLYAIEWGFTILFSIEYVLRLCAVKKPLKYATSFYGIVDLIAIIPTYLSLFIPGTQYLLVVRALRVLRIFRVLKFVQYLDESNHLQKALIASRRKIFIFLFFVLTMVTVLGSLMYLIEGPENGFTSIPRSVYWAIVTLTTVGYGDIVPQTVPGQTLASFIMITGYGVIAVPTGIVTAELTKPRGPAHTQACETCGGDGHAFDATYCKHCGAELTGMDFPA